MIYLITGSPGSGKTLYAVSTLVQSLIKQTYTDDQGQTVTRRLVVDGIPNLLLDHETLCQPVEDEKGNYTCEDGNSVLDWPDWCQKGDVIVIDEVQRYWRPRGMGSKPSRMIKELETHRHKGIDFVIITQSPMLMDQNVRRLIYQHKHIRRIFGAQRAIIYEWDSCAADVSRVKGSQSIQYWGYPKSAYDLYKSSELHTKPKVKVPLWLAVPVLAVLAGVFLIPQAFAVMTGVSTGKGIPTKIAPVLAVVASAPIPISATATATATAVADAKVLADESKKVPPNEPVVYGCIRSAGRCGCYDPAGVKVTVDESVCLTVTGAHLPPPVAFEPPAPRWSSDDNQTIKFAFGATQVGKILDFNQ